MNFFPDRILVFSTVFSAHTDVSRFLQMNELWSYNKDKGLNLDGLHQFSHLLIESKDEEKVRNLASTLEWFIVVKEIQAFNGASIAQLHKFSNS